MLSWMKSATAGLMVPSMLIRSTWRSAASTAVQIMSVSRRNAARMPLSIITAKLFQDLLDIFPDEFFFRGITQEIRRVKSRHELDAFVGVPVAAQSCDRSRRPQ